MCRSTKCAETFLLSSAALANLSFLSPLILTAMSQMDTVSVLLSFLSHNVSPSIYIQDQVATVLANMAARQDTRDLLLNYDLVHVLLYLLSASPTNSQLPVMAATQRVQQKAAIAIARYKQQINPCSGNIRILRDHLAQTYSAPRIWCFKLVLSWTLIIPKYIFPYYRV